MRAKRPGTILDYILKVSNDPISAGTKVCDADHIESGWKKKIAYCIAFSTDGATDVTRRYVRNPAEHGLDRTRCSEEVLLWIMQEIKKMRRENIEKSDQSRLIKEDAREEKELRGYIAKALTAQMVNSVSNAIPSQSGNSTSPTDEVKTPAGRESGSQEWVRARGENGSNIPGSDQRHGSPGR
jgi:peptide-N4-(N-acetyl-beta-glucosaminyl)asparagine amidase